MTKTKARRAFAAYLLVDVFGLTQTEAAEIMGCAQSSVSRYRTYYHHELT